MKKLLALTLALVMLLCMAAGCSNQPADKSNPPAQSGDGDTNNDKQETDQPNQPENNNQDLEPVTLKWYYPGEEMEGSADVIEAFNKKLADLLPNTTVEFTFVGNFDPYGEQWPLLLSGGEEMDIAWEGWNTPLLQDVYDGNVQPLSDLIEKYAPNLQKEIEIWKEDYASVTLDGEIYAIPSIQPNSINESSWLALSKDVYQYFDVHAILEEAHAHDKVTEHFYDLVEEGIQAAVDAGAITLGDNSWYIAPWGVLEIGTRGYISLDKSSQGGMLGEYYVDPTADTPTVMHYLEIPEVQAAAERLKKWKEMGWFTEAQIAGQLQEGAKNILNFNQTLQGNWSDLIDDAGVKMGVDADGEEAYNLLLDTPGQAYVGVSGFGYATAQVVPYTSKHADRAIMLLNLLHDEVGTPGNDLLNLLCYGFEANSEEAATYGWANYTAVEQDGQMFVDTSIRNGADSKHTMVNWVMGNTFKSMHDGSAITTAANKEYAMNYWTDVYPKMKRCSVTGAYLDYMPVSQQLESVSTVVVEYRERIRYGSGLELLQECLNKMNSAGLSEVKAELQSQIDSYVG